MPKIPSNDLSITVISYESKTEFFTKIATPPEGEGASICCSCLLLRNGVYPGHTREPSFGRWVSDKR